MEEKKKRKEHDTQQMRPAACWNRGELKTGPVLFITVTYTVALRASHWPSGLNSFHMRVRHLACFVLISPFVFVSRVFIYFIFLLYFILFFLFCFLLDCVSHRGIVAEPATANAARLGDGHVGHGRWRIVGTRRRPLRYHL
jgi:hypothetical protein